MDVMLKAHVDCCGTGWLASRPWVHSVTGLEVLSAARLERRSVPVPWRRCQRRQRQLFVRGPQWSTLRDTTLISPLPFVALQKRAARSRGLQVCHEILRRQAGAIRARIGSLSGSLVWISWLFSRALYALLGLLSRSIERLALPCTYRTTEDAPPPRFVPVRRPRVPHSIPHRTLPKRTRPTRAFPGKPYARRPRDTGSVHRHGTICRVGRDAGARGRPRHCHRRRGPLLGIECSGGRTPGGYRRLAGRRRRVSIRTVVYNAAGTVYRQTDSRAGPIRRTRVGHFDMGQLLLPTQNVTILFTAMASSRLARAALPAAARSLLAPSSSRVLAPALVRPSFPNFPSSQRSSRPIRNYASEANGEIQVRSVVLLFSHITRCSNKGAVNR
jgi:hypothetical protein